MIDIINQTKKIRMNAYTLLITTIIILSLFMIINSNITFAIPNGAQILSNSTVLYNGTSPDSRADARGTITTIELYGLQQDDHWKAYVGNVSGVLTLDDADGYTIYDWDLTGVTITGEVYAVRTSSVNFDSVSCANIGNITSEETFHNMTASEQDSLSNTFNYTLHNQFFVGANPIAQSTCPSTATYINSTRQSMVNPANIDFQEVLLQDNNDNILYVTLIEDDVGNYRDDNSTYDFQMLVPESNVKSSPTTYYFYTEIGS